jgi:hypothetical protein
MCLCVALIGACAVEGRYAFTSSSPLGGSTRMPRHTLNSAGTALPTTAAAGVTGNGALNLSARATDAGRMALNDSDRNLFS